MSNEFSKSCRSRFSCRKALPTLPAVSVIFIPGLTCPAYWPAYAGLLSSLGIGFINYTPYLFPLMAAMLLIALIPLGFKAKTRSRSCRACCKPEEQTQE